MVTAATWQKAKGLIEEIMAMLAAWLTAYGLEVARKKTEVIFLNSRRIPQDFSLDFEGHTVRASTAVKYLRVTFDRRRNFRVHVAEVTFKALRYAGALSCLMTNLVGPKMAARKLYQAVIESVILYAAPI